MSINPCGNEQYLGDLSIEVEVKENSSPLDKAEQLPFTATAEPAGNERTCVNTVAVSSDVRSLLTSDELSGGSASGIGDRNVSGPLSGKQVDGALQSLANRFFGEPEAAAAAGQPGVMGDQASDENSSDGSLKPEVHAKPVAASATINDANDARSAALKQAADQATKTLRKELPIINYSTCEENLNTTNKSYQHQLNQIVDKVMTAAGGKDKIASLDIRFELKKDSKGAYIAKKNGQYNDFEGAFVIEGKDKAGNAIKLELKNCHFFNSDGDVQASVAKVLISAKACGRLVSSIHFPDSVDEFKGKDVAVKKKMLESKYSVINLNQDKADKSYSGGATASFGGFGSVSYKPSPNAYFVATNGKVEQVKAEDVEKKVKAGGVVFRSEEEAIYRSSAVNLKPAGGENLLEGLKKQTEATTPDAIFQALKENSSSKKIARLAKLDKDSIYETKPFWSKPELKAQFQLACRARRDVVSSSASLPAEPAELQEEKQELETAKKTLADMTDRQSSLEGVKEIIKTDLNWAVQELLPEGLTSELMQSLAQEDATDILEALKKNGGQDAVTLIDDKLSSIETNIKNQKQRLAGLRDNAYINKFKPYFDDLQERSQCLVSIQQRKQELNQLRLDITSDTVLTQDKKALDKATAYIDEEIASIDKALQEHVGKLKKYSDELGIGDLFLRGLPDVNAAQGAAPQSAAQAAVGNASGVNKAAAASAAEAVKNKKSKEFQVIDSNSPLSAVCEGNVEFEGESFHNIEAAFQFNKFKKFIAVANPGMPKDDYEPHLKAIFKSCSAQEAIKLAKILQRNDNPHFPKAQEAQVLNALTALKNNQGLVDLLNDPKCQGILNLPTNGDGAMLDVLAAQFKSNPQFSRTLLATGKAYLLVRSNEVQDNYWTAGNDSQGSNTMGRMLMNMRDYALRQRGPLDFIGLGKAENLLDKLDNSEEKGRVLPGDLDEAAQKRLKDAFDQAQG